MTKSIAAILAGSLCAGLAACGSGKHQSVSAAPPPVSHTVFAPYVNDVRRAKHVQNVVNAQKQALDKAVRAETGAATTTPAPPAQSR
ncbi:MAG: hypothetical protein ACRETQ_13050 [Gammaproteobacteria bacterium]